MLGRGGETTSCDQSNNISSNRRAATLRNYILLAYEVIFLNNYTFGHVTKTSSNLHRVFFVLIPLRRDLLPQDKFSHTHKHHLRNRVCMVKTYNQQTGRQHTHLISKYENRFRQHSSLGHVDRCVLGVRDTVSSLIFKVNPMESRPQNAKARIRSLKHTQKFASSLRSCIAPHARHDDGRMTAKVHRLKFRAWSSDWHLIQNEYMESYHACIVLEVAIDSWCEKISWQTMLREFLLREVVKGAWCK